MFTLLSELGFTGLEDLRIVMLTSFFTSCSSFNPINPNSDNIIIQDHATGKNQLTSSLNQPLHEAPSFCSPLLPGIFKCLIQPAIR